MRHPRVVLPAAIAVAAACGVGAAPTMGATWTNVLSQAVGSGSALGDADALSPTSAWAVGGNGDGIVERYDGTRWSAVATPSLLSARPAGRCSTASTPSPPPARWRSERPTAWRPRCAGTARAGARCPSRPRRAPRARSTTSRHSPRHDAWAVGRIAPTFNGLTLIERWQGSSWTQVASPSPGTRDNTLTDVAGSAPNDLWAVGYSRDLPYGNRARHSLIEHYDGSAWSRVPSPDVDTQTVLYGVAALSSTNAWAVGYASNKGAVVMRFDGHSWTATTLPQLSSLTAICRAVRLRHLGRGLRHRRQRRARQLARLGLDDHPGAGPDRRGHAVAHRARRGRSLHRARVGSVGTAPTAPAALWPSARRTADRSQEVARRSADLRAQESSGPRSGVPS